MELEKLKEIWTSLDNRMQQQEGLKTVIIKEMLLAKSDKALGRMINYGYLGMILLLCLVSLLIGMFTYFPIYHVDLLTPTIITALMLILLALAAGTIGLIKLHKIDFSKSVSYNITAINKYKVFYKRSTLIMYLFTVLFIVFIFISLSQLPYMEPWRLVGVLSSIPVGIILGYWEYKRMYMKNINSILNSLEELKELEEEVDKQTNNY